MATKKKAEKKKPRPPSHKRVLTDKQVCKVLKLLADEKLGLTFRDVAEAMGCSHVTIFRIYHGEYYREVRC